METSLAGFIPKTETPVQTPMMEKRLVRNSAKYVHGVTSTYMKGNWGVWTTMVQLPGSLTEVTCHMSLWDSFITICQKTFLFAAVVVKLINYEWGLHLTDFDKTLDAESCLPSRKSLLEMNILEPSLEAQSSNSPEHNEFPSCIPSLGNQSRMFHYEQVTKRNCRQSILESRYYIGPRRHLFHDSITSSRCLRVCFTDLTMVPLFFSDLLGAILPRLKTNFMFMVFSWLLQSS